MPHNELLGKLAGRSARSVDIRKPNTPEARPTCSRRVDDAASRACSERRVCSPRRCRQPLLSSAHRGESVAMHRSHSRRSADCERAARRVQATKVCGTVARASHGASFFHGGVSRTAVAFGEIFGVVVFSIIDFTDFTRACFAW